MRIGIFYGIFKRLLHIRKPPIHIIQDFHIDLTQTRWLYWMRIALLKLSLPGIDFFCCTSTEEEAIYNRIFGIRPDRIIFLPLEPPSPYCQEVVQSRSDYIFSYGNSDRDYDTLIKAVADRNIHTVILSQQYRSGKALPKNVSLIRNRISDKEMHQWIAGSRMVIIPLTDYRISAGQLSLLQSMSMGRPVVVTRNMATREYAVHLETAMFYDAGNSQELADHIQYLWNHEDISEEIGKQARQICSKFTDQRNRSFIHLLEQCNAIIQKGENR